MTPQILTIEALKEQCRITWNYDDDYILRLRTSALALIATEINRTIYFSEAELADANNSNGLLMNEAINQALALIVGHWYENRQAETSQSLTALPYGVEALLQPYRIYCP